MKLYLDDNGKELAEVFKISLKPGDVLLAKVPSWVAPGEVERFQTMLEEFSQRHHLLFPIMVVRGEVEFEAVSVEDKAQ